MYGWDVLYLHDFPQITGQSRHNSNCLGSVQNHRVVFAAQWWDCGKLLTRNQFDEIANLDYNKDELTKYIIGA